MVWIAAILDLLSFPIFKCFTDNILNIQLRVETINLFLYFIIILCEWLIKFIKFSFKLLLICPYHQVHLLALAIQSQYTLGVLIKLKHECINSSRLLDEVILGSHFFVLYHFISSFLCSFQHLIDWRIVILSRTFCILYLVSELTHLCHDIRLKLWLVLCVLVNALNDCRETFINNLRNIFPVGSRYFENRVGWLFNRTVTSRCSICRLKLRGQLFSLGAITLHLASVLVDDFIIDFHLEDIRIIKSLLKWSLISRTNCCSRNIH